LSRFLLSRVKRSSSLGSDKGRGWRGGQSPRLACRGAWVCGNVFSGKEFRLLPSFWDLDPEGGGSKDCLAWSPAHREGAGRQPIDPEQESVVPPSLPTCRLEKEPGRGHPNLHMYGEVRSLRVGPWRNARPAVRENPIVVLGSWRWGREGSPGQDLLPRSRFRLGW
jgi:hypothetical protein